MFAVARKRNWDDARKTILWKFFVSKSDEYEQRLIRPIRKIFQDELDEVLDKLNREGKKVEGRYFGWSRSKTQIALKKDRDLAKININFKKEERRLRETITPIIRGIMKEHGEERLSDLLEGIKTQFFFNINDPAVKRWIGDRMKKFSKEVTGFTFESIAKIVKAGFAEGEPLYIIGQTLRDKFAVWDKYRAPLIARTETISAMNRADLFAVKQSGMEKELKKHWLSSRDSATRATHLEADTRYKEGIPINELFQVGQDTMLHPGGGKIAEENINCRCTMYYSKIERETEKPIQPPREGEFVFVPPKDERELIMRFQNLNIRKISAEGYRNAEEEMKVFTGILRELERIVYEFPELKRAIENSPNAYLKELKIVNQEYVKVSNKKTRAYGYYDIVEKSIVLATKNKKLQPVLTPGEWIVSEDFYGLLRHEYGHFVFYRIGTRGNWRNYYNLLKNSIKSNISIYAEVKYNEFFAEMFSYYTSPLYGKNEGLTMTETFAKLMKLEIGRRRGGMKMIIEKPKCWERECKHFIGIKELDSKDPFSLVPVCKAFPDGIPEEIAYGDNLHLESFPGDRGIHYERVSKRR